MLGITYLNGSFYFGFSNHESKFADFVINLLDRYSIENNNPNEVSAYGYKYYIPTADYTIVIDSYRMFIFRGKEEIQDFIIDSYGYDFIKHKVSTIQNNIKKQIEEKSIDIKKKSLEMIMLEDTQKFINGIKQTGEFDKVFKDVKRFNEITAEAKEIYKRYSNL